MPPSQPGMAYDHYSAITLAESEFDEEPLITTVIDLYSYHFMAGAEIPLTRS